MCSQPRGNRPGHAAQAPVCVVHHPPLIPPAEHLGTQEANAMVVVKIFLSHLSPGVSSISDLAHDSGILQSELFTSRSQNLVLAKLPNSGFWRYGQFFK